MGRISIGRVSLDPRRIRTTKQARLCRRIAIRNKLMSEVTHLSQQVEQAAGQEFDERTKQLEMMRRAIKARHLARSEE